MYYKVMAMGLINSPASFQRAMEHVFSDLIGNGVYIYIDDILIYGNTIEEHYTYMKKF